MSEVVPVRDPSMGKIFFGENCDKFVILSDNPDREFTSFFLVNSLSGGAGSLVDRDSTIIIMLLVNEMDLPDGRKIV
tara:strand:- start:193 stop:423 length:231 start_codon:yes stop_codon:yes gene_type:complete